MDYRHIYLLLPLESFIPALFTHKPMVQVTLCIRFRLKWPVSSAITPNTPLIEVDSDRNVI